MWIKEMPKEKGMYWFYGDRYDDITEPLELILVNAFKTSNEMLYVGNGQFLERKEFGEKWWFKKFEGIELPE